MKETIASLVIASLFIISMRAGADDSVGKEAYEKQCAACHQVTGEGLVPVFPALKGSKVVTSEDIEEQISLVLHGKPGTAMLPFARLSDDDLAAIISYTRSAWGNDGGEVTAEDVKKARKQDK